jgi:guanylate kinase
MSSSGTLFIVSAPSGAGKTTLVSGLLAADPVIHKSISFTTRAPRSGEENGRAYHFIGAEEFERMRARGEFLETAEVHGNLYGTSRRTVETVAIFILPPSIEALEKRLRGRAQDSTDVIAKRIAAARGEISHVGEFDYVIINEEFNRAAQELVSIIRAERLRLPRQLARHTDLINRILGRDPE